MTAEQLQELVDTVRKCARLEGADESEAFGRSVRSTLIEVKNGQVEGINCSSEAAVALRVLVEDRPGFSYFSNPDAENIKAMAKDSISGARLVPPQSENRFAARVTPGPAEGIYDQAGFNRPFEEKVGFAKRVESAAHEASAKVSKTHKPSFSERHRISAIASGDGVWSYEDTVFSVGVEAVAEGDGGSQTGFDYSVSRNLDDLDPETVGRRAALEAEGLLGGESPPTGQYPVILPPKMVTDLLGVLAASFSADEVQKGRSRLAGRVGESVFSPLVTISDEGTLPGGTGTVPFDDEGAEPQPRTLVEKGVVKGWLHTLKTAAKEGETPTGNGFRGSLSSYPAPNYTNLVFQPGDAPVQSRMPAGDALLIMSLMGVHTANPVTGEFSLGAAGFMLRGGDRVRPFRNATVSGNLFSLFSSVLAVGNDLSYYGAKGSPTILIESVIISGK